MKKLIKLWKAIGTNQTMYSNTDWDEDDYEIGIFTTEEGAKEAARGKGINGDGKIVSLIAYDNLKEKRDRKFKAISELTKEQKMALGFEDSDEDDDDD